MSDRIIAIIAVPIDTALPLDVQGVGLRRKAIEAMQKVANVDESSVRYEGATDSASIDFSEPQDGSYLMTLWERNLLAARFRADGDVHKGICGAVVDKDPVLRFFSRVSVARNEFD